MVIVVWSLSHVWLFATPHIAVSQAPLSFILSQSLLKFLSIESVMPSNHLILCCPLLFPQSFPASLSFPISLLFASDGQNIGVSASASVLPVNIQGWFPLGLTVLISLLSKGLSRVFSNTTVQKHQFFSAQSSLWSNFHIYTWLLGEKNSFDYLCEQSDVSAFPLKALIWQCHKLCFCCVSFYMMSSLRMGIQPDPFFLIPSF